MWKRKSSKNALSTISGQEEKKLELLSQSDGNRTNLQQLINYAHNKQDIRNISQLQEQLQQLGDSEPPIRSSRSTRRGENEEGIERQSRSERRTDNKSSIFKKKPKEEQPTSQTTYSSTAPNGAYAEIITPVKQQLFIYSNKEREELNLSGIASPSIITTDEMKEQAQLYKKLDKKLLMHIDTNKIYYWDQKETSMTRTFLPSELIAIYGRASMKELVEPLSKTKYMFLGGHLVPISWRSETNIHPNHIVAAGILRQVLPPMLFFHEPSTNLTYYFRYAQDLSFPQSRLVRFTDNTAEGETVVTPEVMIASDSASFNRIMATPRMNNNYKLPPKKGCL